MAKRLASLPMASDPWDHFVDALAEIKPLLAAPSFEPRLKKSFLWTLVTVDDPLKDAAFGDTWQDYPAECRRGLCDGRLIAADSADVYFLWPGKKGLRVCHAHPEGFWVLGESLADFVRRERQKMM